MPATVPLTTPVKSMNSARALAEAAALADPDANIGPAIDRIMRYLQTIPYCDLQFETEGVLDIVHLLGLDCAAVVAQWLARWAVDPDTRAYWSELDELVRMGF
jgi:hypothetical protein